MLAVGMLVACAVVLAGRLAPAIESEAQQAATAQTIDFTSDIAPIFEAKCVQCHSVEVQQNRLRLDSEAAALAALIEDLKQRGMLDETLVIWGGEFGRTPMNEERNRSKFLGRDHHPRAFSIWLAGGSIKPGITLGQTDELGHNIVEDPVDVHDLHATILHQTGLDHTKLTYKFQGREFRLTDVTGNIIEKLLA